MPPHLQLLPPGRSDDHFDTTGERGEWFLLRPPPNLPPVPRAFLILFLVLTAALCAQAADPLAELGAFSVFQNANLDKLKSEVTTARGPAMTDGRHLSVQSCYVVPVPPAKALEALQQWDASRHRELKIYVHGDLPGSPTPASFSKLGSAPDNAAVATLAEKTQKGSHDLQISNGEKPLLPAGPGGKGPLPDPVQSFWSNVLSGRAQNFVANGAARQPGYEFTGQEVKSGDELASLLRQQDKIRKQFAGFLGDNGVSGGRGSLKKDLYFELIDVDDEGVLTLGSFSSKAVGSGFQAADVTYYASGGYYAGLTLYQMWPVEVGGQASTLVWRGDMISAASLATLHGMEKLASESAMMKDISKAVRLLKGDMATGR